MKITSHSISSCRDTFQCWAILRVRDKYPSVISQGIYSPICQSPAPYISLYHQFSKVKEPSLVFNYGSQSKTNSQRTDQRITVLFRFFHETCPFFKGFERTGTCDSLILKHWKNRNWRFFRNSKNRPTLVWRSTFVHFWVEKEINQSNWSARRFERRERRDDSGETKSGGGRLRSDERERERASGRAGHSTKLWRLWPKLCPSSQVHHSLLSSYSCLSCSIVASHASPVTASVCLQLLLASRVLLLPPPAILLLLLLVEALLSSPNLMEVSTSLSLPLSTLFCSREILHSGFQVLYRRFLLPFCGYTIWNFIGGLTFCMSMSVEKRKPRHCSCGFDLYFTW